MIDYTVSYSSRLTALSVHPCTLKILELSVLPEPPFPVHQNYRITS
jgi:hypothetical protein